MIDVRNQIYDTFDLRRFRSNTSVDIPNHDEEEGEAEEAAGFQVFFMALESEGRMIGSVMFDWSRVFSVFE